MTTDDQPPGGEAPPPDVPTYAAFYDPAKPGDFAADWITKAPPTEAEMWQEYKDAKNPIEALKGERQRRIDAQTALRTKSDKAANLPSKPEGDAATPEAWEAYRTARGLPKDHTGYGLVRPADYPEALWNDAETEAFTKLALDAEMTPAQVAALAQWYQGRGKEALAAHEAAVDAQKAAEEKAKSGYVMVQKQTLIQNHGTNVDRDLKTLGKLTAITGLDPEMLNPDNPDKWVGADVVKSMMGIVAMLPKSGDPTARMLGSVGGSSVKDRAYFQNLKAGDEDLKALSDVRHPRHAQVVQEKQDAMERDLALNQK